MLPYATVFGRYSKAPFKSPVGWDDARFWVLHSDRELLLAECVLHDVGGLLNQCIAFCAADDSGRDYESFLASHGPRFVLKILPFPAFMDDVDFKR
jgi:hypothetical protein